MRFPQVIELRRSRLLLAGLSAGHLLAMACVLSLPWPLFFQLLLVGLVAASWWRGRRGEGDDLVLRLAAPDSIACRLRTCHSEWRSCRLLPGAVVMGPLVLLRLQSEGEAKLLSLVLMPDSAAPEALRVLRVWLRCYRPLPEARASGNDDARSI